MDYQSTQFKVKRKVIPGLKDMQRQDFVNAKRFIDAFITGHDDNGNLGYIFEGSDPFFEALYSSATNMSGGYSAEQRAFKINFSSDFISKNEKISKEFLPLLMLAISAESEVPVMLKCLDNQLLEKILVIPTEDGLSRSSKLVLTPSNYSSPKNGAVNPDGGNNQILTADQFGGDAMKMYRVASISLVNSFKSYNGKPGVDYFP